MKTLIIDVGNSRVGAAVHDDAEPGSWRVLGRWLHSRNGGGFEPSPWVGIDFDRWVVGSVHALGARLARELSSRAPGTFFGRGDQFPVRCAVRSPERVGVDRLAACLAAFELGERREAIVVDLGTAITVDWIDGQGEFQGGAIVPGWRLCALVLHEHTSRLPRVERSDEGSPLPGRDTVEAIDRGLSIGVVAMVESLVSSLLCSAGIDPSLWVTGGDGAWFERQTRLSPRVDPDLVFKGLRLGGLRKESGT